MIKKYKKGGKWSPDNKGNIQQYSPQGVSIGTQPYQDWEHRQNPTPYISDYDRQVAALRAQQANTPAIGAKPTWQQEIYRQAAKHPILMNTVGYPVQAVAKLTDPNYSYIEGNSGYGAFPGAANAVMDIESVITPFGIRSSKPVPKQSIPRSGFPTDVIRKIKGNAGKPILTEVPELTKEQQILQSHGLDPFKKRISDNEIKDAFAAKNIEDDFIELSPEDMSIIDRVRDSRTKGEQWKTSIPGSKEAEYKALRDKMKMWDKEIDDISNAPVGRKYQQGYGKDIMFLTKGPSGKGEVFSKGYTGDNRGALYNSYHETFLHPGEEIEFPRTYNKFGPHSIPKTVEELIEREKNPNRFPEHLSPTMIQQNKYGGTITSQDMKRNMKCGGKYMPKMANGGPKKQWEMPSSGIGVTDYTDMYSLPGMGLFNKMDRNAGWEGYGNPDNLITNQQPDVYAVPVRRPISDRQLAMDNSEYSVDRVREQYMRDGGYTQKPGYFWNGYSMERAKQGAYDTMFKDGGMVQVPVAQHMGRYGLNLYKQGGMVNVPVEQHMYRYGLNLYKDGGIHIKPENRGKFGRWAKSHGMGTQEAASHVMANKEDYSSGVVRMANFAKNAASWKHKNGGMVYDNGGGINLPGTNPWAPVQTNTEEQMQDVYQPVAQANVEAIQIDDNSYQNRPRVTTDVLSGPQDSGTNPGYQVSPQVQTEQISDTTVQPRRPFGTGYRNLLGAAMIYGQYAANQRQNKNLQAYGIQQGMTKLNPSPTPFSRGTYNQQGQLMNSTMKYGGKMYRTGGVYEMDDNELEMLKMGGYTYKLV